MALTSSLAAVLLLVVVHVFAHRLKFLEGTPRSIWLSIAGGIAVAYVFLHLLPELAEGQKTIAEAAGNALGFVEHHAYLISLLGLVGFYGLERAARESRTRNEGATDRASSGVFWLHMVSYGLYNILIGYLLATRERELERRLVFFTIAMALHFLVSDYGLREHFKGLYLRIGRWLLSLTVIAGWVAGRLVELPESATAILIAALAGGVILNVLKEELPEERHSRFSAFAIGAVAYSVLLLTL